MANAGWLLILLLMINLMLVLGGVMDTTAEKGQGGVLSSLFDINNTNNPKDIDEGFKETTQNITSGGVVSGTDFEGFTDSPSAVATMFNRLFDISTAAFQLIFNPNISLPIQLRLILGLPLSVAWIFALIAFWRTGD